MSSRRDEMASWAGLPHGKTLVSNRAGPDVDDTSVQPTITNSSPTPRQDALTAAWRPESVKRLTVLPTELSPPTEPTEVHPDGGGGASGQSLGEGVRAQDASSTAAVSHLACEWTRGRDLAYINTTLRERVARRTRLV